MNAVLRDTSGWMSLSLNQAKKVTANKKASQEMGGRLNTYLQPERTNRDNKDLTSEKNWLSTAEDTSKWDAMESNFLNSRLKQPARPTTSISTTTTTHEHTMYTTDAHDQNEDDTKDDDDTLLILS